MTQIRRVDTAIILAAGRGQRLRPITDSIPKPLIKVGPRTLLEYHLENLIEAGFRRVVINLSHLGEQISEFLGDGGQFGIEIAYSWEPPGALETAGGIRHALELLDAEQFMAINGDIRCSIGLDELMLPEQSSMHLVLVPNPSHNPAGDFAVDSSYTPLRLRDPASRATTYTFSGIGLYRKSIFSSLPDRVQPLAPVIREQIKSGLVTAQIHDGAWFDIGTPKRLEAARRAYPAQAPESQ
ncbi:MAG: nucleotidyltransferase family protein [Gammaproteobacteria bacterium]